MRIEAIMPVKIGSFEEWFKAEFEELRQRGAPVRVPLMKAQRARACAPRSVRRQPAAV